MGRIDLMMELEQDSPRSDVSYTGRQLDDADVADIYKDYDLYLTAKNGSLAHFILVLDRVSSAGQTSLDDILRRLSPLGNTFLHLAAKHGNEVIVNYVAEKIPSLISCKNFNGDTALHVAARAGYESMVRALVRIYRNLLLLNSQSNNLLREINERGNTALHEALICRRKSVAQYLIQEDPEVSYHLNKQGESVLYFAVKAGFADCASSILGFSTDLERLKDQFKRKSPTQKAIMMKDRDALEAMLKSNPSIIQLRDGDGRTLLHFAAFLGHLGEVKYLLDKHTLSATQRDKSGLFPIHLASIKGHVDIVSLLLQYSPDPGELLDIYGRNILHLAAQNGRYNVVRYILKNPDLEELINMKDKLGNAPLHLATLNWYPKIVSALTWDKRVNVKLVNNNGGTALDVVEYHMSDNPQFRQRLIWAALKAAGAPRYMTNKTVGRQASKKNSKVENYKDRVNTLLLVATLIATITFAAGFTMPGGYNSSDKDLGMATMLRKTGFHIFVICDTIAMYSSIVVAVALIWAQMGDLALVLNAVRLALPLLVIALSMMSMAFMAGVLVVVGKLVWLSIAVLVMGVSFLVVLLVLLIPLCMPITSSNWILRYISYYPFYLLILSTSSDPKD